MAVELQTPEETKLEAMIAKALEIERLEAAVKQMKNEIREWVENNGPLIAGDRQWLISESVSWDFTPEKLKELAKAIAIEGKNPWDYLSIQARGLNSLNWNEEFISKHGSKKITKRFSSRKAD